MQRPFQFLPAARLSISERSHRDARQRFDDAAIQQRQGLLNILQTFVCRDRNELLAERFNDGLESLGIKHRDGF